MRHKAAQEALSTASYLFLFVGAIALFEMALHAARGALHFNFGVLGIGIFFGLRRYSRAWRWCALAFTWYGMITLCIALYVCLNGQPPSPKLVLYSNQISKIPPSSLSIPLLMVLFATFWQYRVLTHPAVRRLFRDVTGAHTPEAAVNPAMGGAAVKQ